MPLSPRTNPGHGSGEPRYPGTFLAAFREVLDGLKWQVRRWLGDAVECADAQGRAQIVGLENLFRRARQAPREQWPALITDFLAQAALPNQPDDLPKNLADVADQLLVRLGPPFTHKVGNGTLWSQPVAGTNFVINLVIDYPNRMIYVTEQMVNESGRPAGDWLERALANLRARTPQEAFQSLDAEVGLKTCAVGDAYDSSRALLLDTLLPTGKADGFFVALPARDQLLVMAVAAPALAILHIMKLLVDKSFKSMPYPISNHIFWLRAGVWRRFGVEIEGNQVNITPPEEFVEVLERIGPPSEKAGEERESEEG